MEINLLLVPMINLILLSIMNIKEFFINPLFNNGFMGYFIKWTTVASYGVAFITCIISIYFFTIALIKENHEGRLLNKVGLILFLVAVTATALTCILLKVFQ